MYSSLNDAQREYLLRPLAADRVAKRSQAGRSLSYVEAWDIKRTLIRVFGFGGWSWDVQTADLAFEDTVLSKSGGDNWNVGYKVIGRLKIEALYCTYTEAAIGSATLPSRGDAHDMAIKTAESDALKRCAINLGTQFGLSLYDNGALNDVVGRTLELTDGKDQKTIAGEAISEALRITEPAVANDEGAEEWVERLREAMNAGDVVTVVAIKSEMVQAGVLDLVHDGKTLAKIADLAVVYAGKNAAKAGLGGEEVTE